MVGGWSAVGLVSKYLRSKRKERKRSRRFLHKHQDGTKQRIVQMDKPEIPAIMFVVFFSFSFFCFVCVCVLFRGRGVNFALIPTQPYSCSCITVFSPDHNLQKFLVCLRKPAMKES